MKRILQTFVLPLLMLLAGSNAYAYDDWQEMTLGVPLSYSTAWSAVGGYFTLTQDKTVVLEINSQNTWGSEDSFCIYPNQSLEGPLLNSNKEEGAGTYSLSAGTYYVYCLSVWGPGSVTVSELTGGVVLTIDENIPAAGSVFSPTTNNGRAGIHADFNVIIEKWQIVSGSYASAEQTVDLNAWNPYVYASVFIQPEVIKLYDNGKQAGDRFTVVFKGVQNVAGDLYGEDGTYSIEYVLGEKPIMLQSSTLSDINPNTLLSYYLPGADNSTCSFTFTMPVDTSAPVTVEQIEPGNPNNAITRNLTGPLLELSARSDYTAQVLYYTGTYSNDNKTVTFDFSGKDFGSWNDAYPKYQPVFKVMNIKDLNGNLAPGSSESTPGAYVFQADYLQYQQASFECMWTPASGSMLQEQTELNIVTTITDMTGVKKRLYNFDGMKFTAADGTTITVPRSSCQFTSNADGYVTVNCPTPAEMLDKENVNVKMIGMLWSDGLYYSEDMFSADFNPQFEDASSLVSFAAVSISNEEVTSEYIQSIVSINVYTELTYDGSTPTLTCSDPSVVRQVWFVNTNPSTAADGRKFYTISVGQPVSLTSGNGASVVTEGTTFTISFPEQSFSNGATQYGQVSYTWTFGQEPEVPVEPEEFDITLLSPDPSQPVAEEDDNEFVFNVVGEPVPAVLRGFFYDGNNELLFASSVVKGDDNRWTCYAMNMLFIEGQTYTLIIKGYSSQSEADQNMTPSFTKTITFDGASAPIVYKNVTVTVNPAEGDIQPSDTYITFTFSEPVKLTKAQINLPKLGDGQAQEPIAITPFSKSLDSNGNSTTWNLNLETVDYDMMEYTYLAIIIYGKDADGAIIKRSSDSELGLNTFMKFEWNILNGADLADITVVPDFGEVESIEELVIHYDGVNELQETWNVGDIYLTDAIGNKVKFEPDYSNEDMTISVLRPAAAVTEPGEYTLVVPEGYYYLTGTGVEKRNRELTGVYTIPEKAESLQMEFFLDDECKVGVNYQVETFQNLFIRIPGATQVTLNSSAGTPHSSSSYFENKEVLWTKNVQMSLRAAVTSKTTVTVTIPEGYIEATVDGKSLKCERTVVTINVSGPLAASVDVTVNIEHPNSEVLLKEISEIGLSFEGIENAAPNRDNMLDNITLKQGYKTLAEWSAGNLYYVYNTYLTENYLGWFGTNGKGEKRTALVLPLMDSNNQKFSIDEAGTYTLSVPEKFFIIDNTASAPASAPKKAVSATSDDSIISAISYTKAMSLTLKVDPEAGITTGVENVVADVAGSYEVYNLNGVKVLSTTDASELNTLHPGIYIVNGKKLVIR